MAAAGMMLWMIHAAFADEVPVIIGKPWNESLGAGWAALPERKRWSRQQRRLGVSVLCH